jgi:hypothetical protein
MDGAHTSSTIFGWTRQPGAGGIIVEEDSWLQHADGSLFTDPSGVSGTATKHHSLAPQSYRYR